MRNWPRIWFFLSLAFITGATASGQDSPPAAGAPSAIATDRPAITDSSAVVPTAYKIQSKQQVDFHFGVGLSPAAPHYFIGVGYSFRLP